MSLPAYSSLTPPRPTTLAQAVEQVRHPRNRATAQLTPHREELLRLHQAGESPETLASGLRLIGVEIGRETMRRWLQQELGQKPAKRRKRPTRRAPVSAAEPGTIASTVALATNSVAPATIAIPPHTSSGRGGANEPVPEGTRFIRPGETPLEAWNRRQAERVVLETANAAVKATPGAPSGSPVKDT